MSEWEDAPSANGDEWEDAPSLESRYTRLMDSSALQQELEEKTKHYRSNPVDVAKDSANLGLPLGLAETLMMVPGVVGSTIAGGLGGVAGALIPGDTAAEGYQRSTQAVNDVIGYTPRTKSGQALAGGIGAGIESFKDYAGNPEQSPLRLIPGIGDQLADSPIGAAAGGLASALPELSILTPMLGGRGHKTRQAATETPEVASRTEEVIKREKSATEAVWEDAPSAAVVEDPFAQMKRQLDTPQTNEGPFISKELLDERQAPIKATERITEYLEEAPAREADRLQAERQAQADLEVKRQATLDFNAAERARQEAAPTGFERSPEAIARDPDVMKINEKITKQEETVIKLAEAIEEGTLPKNHLERALRDLGYMEDTLANMKQLVEAEVLERTQTRPGFPAFQEKSGPFIPKGQRGAINPEVFKEGFQKLKQLADGTWLRAFSHGDTLTIEATKDSHKLGGAVYEKTSKYTSPAETNLAATATGFNKEFQRKGLATEVYKFASELGNDIVPSKIRTKEGSAMWDSFERKGMSTDKVIRSPGNKQMGAILASQTGANATPVPPRRTPPPTPEQMAANAHRRRIGQQFPHLRDALSEFDVIKTKEEAIELGKNARDIQQDIGQKSLGSGINFQAIMSNSPVLKFARTVFRDARVKANQFSSRFVTAKDVGMSPIWAKLSGPERVAVMDALQSGDKHQFQINDSVMNQLGFNDKQRQLVKTFYAADERLFADWNAELERVGLKQIRERTGHFPGIFTGAYKTVVAREKVVDGKKVLDKKGNPVMESLGIIATDTRAQQKLAQDHVRQQYPEARFVEQKRASLAGSANRYYSDIFSGMNDVMEMLGKEDPRFLEIQELVSGAVTQANNRLFNFNVHELSKKGVFGNDGNRPWLSPERNANDAFKSLVRYFEEGAQHHALQVPLKEVREVANSPELSHLPNTMKYLDAYMKKITGDDLSPLGGAINTILDAPFKLMPTISWGKDGLVKSIKDGKVTAGIGVGPSVPLQVSGVVKNTMSQMFMGFGNYMFTLSQLIQPGQTGLPFMQLAAGRLGLDVTNATKSFGKGGVDFLLAFTEHATGDRIELLPEHMRQAYHYAQERGLLEFSEMEKAYQGTQSKVGRVKDKVAEFNMKIGEQATRAPMLMAFTDLLVRGGIDVKTALPIAENLTQFSMIDYHAWERPMVYSKMGVLGHFAGGLTTFKHGYASQQIKLGQELVAPINGPRQKLPIAMSVGAMMTLAGITGSPFYSELDSAYQYLTDKFGGESKTIRESFLASAPEWLNSGLVSNATNLNLQGKFSSADIVPDSLAKAASPHLEGAARIIGNAIDVAKSGGDEQSVRNLLLSLTPSGWRGIPENQLARDDENFVIGKDGLRTVQRTDEEWNKRVTTGLRPQSEAIAREGTWAARLKQMKDVARQKDIAKEYERAIINGTIDQKAEKLEKEYVERKGDINNLLSLYKTVALKRQLNEKERLEGLPSTLSGVERFMYYNK
jgi:hypothetical protein